MHKNKLDGQVVYCCDFCDLPWLTEKQAEDCFEWHRRVK